MKILGWMMVAVALGGCSLTGKNQITPQDYANGAACIAQVQAIAATAKQQVSACVELGQSIYSRAGK